MPRNNIPAYLDILSSKEGSLPIHSLYEVVLGSAFSLANSVKDTIGAYEVGGSDSAWVGKFSRESKDIEEGGFLASTTDILLYNADTVTLPGGTNNFQADLQLDAPGGYIPGLVNMGRVNDNTFTITIREAEEDIALMFIEAWRRSIAHKGFIDFTLRANISIYEYARVDAKESTNNEPEVKRIHSFDYAAPVTVSEIIKSHNNQGEVLSRTITFACSQYTVRDA